MKSITVNFYLREVSDGTFTCNSVLTTRTGYGDTQEQAIEDHCYQFNNAKLSKFDTLAKDIPNVTIKQLILTETTQP